MRRAVSSLLDWIFSLDRFDRIHAFVRLDNVRSAGLLQRLGFRHEGCLRSYRICRGKAFDFAVYGLLRSEWAATR
jgi:RimJ/RimL family protein N-acetyltransferase